jgi:hypothetical protein
MRVTGETGNSQLGLMMYIIQEFQCFLFYSNCLVNKMHAIITGPDFPIICIAVELQLNPER